MELDGDFFFIRSIEGEDDKATRHKLLYYAWLLSYDNGPVSPSETQEFLPPSGREKSNRKYMAHLCINICFFFFIIYYLDINRYLFLSSIASESDSGSGLMFLINLLAGILSVYPNVYIPLDLLLQFMTS